MAFTQSCYITKNTVELRNQLENLGYKYGGRERNSNLLPSIYCHEGTYYECMQKPPRDHSIVDCGTHEELFLAIASLRNDTAKNQWFICKEEYIGTHHMELIKVGTFVLCVHDKLSYSLNKLWKKATVKELQTHFLGK